MSRGELLAYAKSITRDHGRAQEAINRLRCKLRMWEAGTPPAPFAPRPRILLRHTTGWAGRAPARGRMQRTGAPHQPTHQTAQEGAHHARAV